MGRQPHRRAAAGSTGRRCTPRPSALFARLGVAHRPAPPGPRPLDRRPADHRDREGHLARRQPADHGRADRRPQRGRGRPALRGRPQPARRGPGPGLHLPPLRRGVRALRHRHRDARRRVRLHRGDRRHLRRPDRRADGRPRGRRPVPQDPGRGRRRRCSRSSGLDQRRHLPRRLLHRPRRRDRRPRRPGRRRPQRDRPRRLRRRPLRRRHGPPGRPRRTPARPARRRSAPGSRSSPRTAASRAWSPRAPWPATSPASSAAGSTRAGLLTNGDENRAAAPVGRPARGQDQRARHARHAR